MQGEIEYHTKERVTIKDISAKLGISSTTVHRALAGKEGMTDELRDKIQRMLNYLQRLILIWPFNASPYDSLLQLHVPRRNLY